MWETRSVMKTLKQRVQELDFQPYPSQGKDAEFVAFDGRKDWWLGKTNNPHLFTVNRKGAPARLGGYAFFTNLNGFIQPAKKVGRSYEAVPYGEPSKADICAR